MSVIRELTILGHVNPGSVSDVSLTKGSDLESKLVLGTEIQVL